MTGPIFISRLQGFFGHSYTDAQSAVLERYLDGKSAFFLETLLVKVLRTFVATEPNPLPLIATLEDLTRETCRDMPERRYAALPAPGDFGDMAIIEAEARKSGVDTGKDGWLAVYLFGEIRKIKSENRLTDGR